MAIEFARARFISRSKGGNAVRSAAYNARDALYSERTGLTYTFRDSGTLVHHEILLPAAATSTFADAETLWNAVEAAEHRKNSQVAFEVVLALPADKEISDADRLTLARNFALEHFARHGLAVQVDIHRPHVAETNPETTNHHAHLLVTTRRVEDDRLASHKARDLHPQVHRVGATPVVTSAEQWGALWRDAQNAYFDHGGKSICVDPVAVHPGAHIGPRRFRHPHDPRLATANALQELNSKVARDPAAVTEHLRDHPRALDRHAVSRFLTKHISDPQIRADVQADVHDRLQVMRRSALDQAAVADKVSSGWRRLFVEDIARESPEYLKLTGRAALLRKAANKADWIRSRMDSAITEATYRLNLRWAGMSVAQRLLHTTRLHRDAELERWSVYQRRHEYGKHRWSIRQKAFTDKLAAVTRLADRELEKLRPGAERELQRRQQVAHNAREALKVIAQQDLIQRQRQRPLTNAPPL